MKTRDVIIGFVVLVILVGGALWVRKAKRNAETPVPTPNITERISKSFNLEIPDDVDKAELTDVSGGDGSGVATRKYEAGTFSHTVLADLADPEAGTFYEAWLVRGNPGDANFAYFSTGKLRIAKGGYLLDFSSSKDYSDYTKVVVTLEKVFDKTPEQHILEGSF